MRENHETNVTAALRFHDAVSQAVAARLGAAETYPQLFKSYPPCATNPGGSRAKFKSLFAGMDVGERKRLGDDLASGQVRLAALKRLAADRTKWPEQRRRLRALVLAQATVMQRRIKAANAD